ncbi:hypothetical protein C360_05209 [Cryptococcus neoformans Bt15]|nr:hypothetical protein C360_05209 [Cryptococcus neoformans var. grubii Bt15]
MVLYSDGQTCTNTYGEYIAVPWGSNDVIFEDHSSTDFAISSSNTPPSTVNKDAPICPISNIFREPKKKSSCNTTHSAPAKSKRTHRPGLTRNPKACNPCKRKKKQCQGYYQGICERCKRTPHECIWDEDDSQRGVKKAKAQAALHAARKISEQTNLNRSPKILLASPEFNQPLFSSAHRICEASEPMPIDSTISNSQSSLIQNQGSLLTLGEHQDLSISNLGPFDSNFDFDQYQHPRKSPSQLSSAEGPSILSIEQIESYAIQSRHTSCSSNELNTGNTNLFDVQYSIPSTSSTELGSLATSSISPTETFGASADSYEYHGVSSFEINSVDDQDFTALGIENLALRRAEQARPTDNGYDQASPTQEMSVITTVTAQE